MDNCFGLVDRFTIWQRKQDDDVTYFAVMGNSSLYGGGLMDKAEIIKILEEFRCNIDPDPIDDTNERLTNQATSSLTALIIKWLENADICDKCKNKLLTNLTDRI